MKTLKECANGCGVPPDPPSKVICKKCQQEITKGLQKLADKLKEKHPKEFEEVCKQSKEYTNYNKKNY